MEEQTSWKGQTFTLMIFGGIVVLCSIFFILGMLVGRSQAQKLAAAAAEAGAVPPPVKEIPTPPPDLSAYDSLEKNREPVLDPPLSRARPDQPAVVSKPAPEDSGAVADVVNFQIIALKRSADAQKMVDQLKKKGFRAFVVAPVSGDANPLYRVQVGPISNAADADSIKKRLESAGYKPIVKK